MKSKGSSPAAGERSGSMVDLIHDLYPLCRSITGEGVRETLRRIGRIIPLEIKEIPTGTRVFDWEIPREWNIRDAYIKDSAGNRVVDFRESNLHVVNYSIPVEGHFSLADLKEHIHTDPEKPGWIPYRTSYYAERWGFCMSHHQLEEMKEEMYEVKIDSSLEAGSLTYGEFYIPGKSSSEVLLSTHICHPSLCNDNLSGIAVNTLLAESLAASDPYYSYRFIFIPGTIGAIAWLSENEKKLQQIRYGIVTSLLGMGKGFTFKRSRSGTEQIDRIMEHVLKSGGYEHNVIDFIPYGYDERQFCSPGINLPVCSLSRIPYGQFPEYHTSADNLELLFAGALDESLQMLEEVVSHIEADRRYLNLFPRGEPQLGRRGLYENLGGRNDSKQFQMALLWVLNFSDGSHSLTDIALRSGIPVLLLTEAAVLLEEKELIKQA